MNERLKDLINSPNDDDPSYVRMLRRILIFTTIGLAAIMIAISISNLYTTDPYYKPFYALIPTFVFSLISILFLQRGILWLGKILIPFASIFAIAFLSFQGRGLHDTSVFAIPLIIVLASLLMGRNATALFSYLSIIVLAILGIGDMTGLIDHEISQFTEIDDVIITIVFIGVMSGALRLLLTRLLDTISKVNETNRELVKLRESLEQRVTERTLELEKASQQIERRAKQFEAISQVSRTISSVHEQEELLPRITSMISHYFGFYHVGIFLLNEKKTFAVLRAANSEGGQKMLARDHRLEVGQTGIVGNVAATGSPRIALDVGEDAAYFDNPDLPNTRSEMALPLLEGSRVIGALDVQSVQPNAFSQEDVNILSSLADQVSTAIQNANLFDEARKALAQAEAATSQVTGRAWSDFQNQAPVQGYHFDGNKPEPLTRSEDRSKTDVQKDTYSIPIQLRGETIGNLSVTPPSEGHQWTDDEIAIMRATAERVALAAENARLLDDAQRRATKEQVIGDISSKIGAAINLDNIIQTTLREMGRILPDAEISIEVENE